MSKMPVIVEAKNPNDWLEFWAESTPSSPALLSPKLSLSFEALLLATETLSFRFAELGVVRGSRVVTFLPEEIYFIATLALQRLGAASISGSSTQISTLVQQGFQFGVTVEGSGIPETNGITWISITHLDMMADEDVLAVSDPVSYKPTDVIHYFADRGGELVGMNLETLLSRVSTWFQIDQRPQRTLALSEPNSSLGFTQALKTLAMGLPVLVLGHGPFTQQRREFVQASSVERLTGSAFSVSKFLLASIEAGLSLAHLKTIELTNSTLTPKFFDFVKARTGAEIRTVYESLEVGPLFSNTIRAKSELGDLGELVPDARIRILAEGGSPVLPGDFGQVFAQSFAMAVSNSRTFQAPQQDLKGFVSLEHTMARVEGRYWLGPSPLKSSTVGGDAVPMEAIESFGKAQPGVREVACFEAIGKNGEPVFAMAVSALREFNLQDFANSVKVAFPGVHPSVFTELPGIPKDATGAPHKAHLAQTLFS